ncbi:MAG: RNA polymerase factor sigma-32 [Deltaproteobacteria bacterium]|nr:RNA polymerase factor sigma-32 [Deltaproteobacteria bacterium]
MADEKAKRDTLPEVSDPAGEEPDIGEYANGGAAAELVEDEAETLFVAMAEEEEASRYALARAPSRALAVRKRAPLARYDPLQAYMRDVKRYQLLTPEEEQATAIQYFEAGDVQAAAKLVTSNLRLVVKIAYDYRNAYKNLMDIVQEGNIGLMQAVRKYDPYKGVKLSTYAAWWIRAYILRFILNNARLVKLGTTQAQRKLFFNLKKEKAKLAALGIEPTSDVVAKQLDVSKQEVIEMDRRLAAGDLSLDAPIKKSDEGSKSRVDLLREESKDVDDILADEQIGMILREKLEVFGRTLNGKEEQIFNQRLISEEPRTLQELGDEFGVSRERVRQIEKRLQDKIKKFLSEEMGEGAFEV